MGYMLHHAIIVTSWSRTLIEEAQKQAEGFGCCPTNLTAEVTNGYSSFMVPPDGSKEGWDESNEGDRRRSAFKEWLRSQEYDDGRNSLNWLEVSYSSDDYEAKVTDHSYPKRGATNE